MHLKLRNQNNFVHTHTHIHRAIEKPHGNHNQCLKDTHTIKWKRNPNITLKIIIKAQENKRTKKSKTINKMTVRIHISNNYLKCTSNTDLHHDILKVKDKKGF